ncbi:MAG TPA: outer membrane beta-barrel protein [Bacteroidota bacterium]
MRKLAIAVVVLVLFSGTAPAQLSYELNAGGGISVSNFPDQIKDWYSTGFGGAIGGTIMFSQNLGIRVSADYRWFSSDKDKIKSAILAEPTLQQLPGFQPALLTIDGLNVSILGVTLNGVGKAPLNKNVAPYVTAGVGMYSVKASDANVSYNGQAIPGGTSSVPSETKVGFNGGVGIDFTLGLLGLYLEGKYVTIRTDNSTNHFPVTVGLFLNL